MLGGQGGGPPCLGREYAAAGRGAPAEAAEAAVGEAAPAPAPAPAGADGQREVEVPEAEVQLLEAAAAEAAPAPAAAPAAASKPHPAELPAAEVEVLQVIGKGSCSVLHLAKLRGHHVALKELKPCAGTDVQQELQILRQEVLSKRSLNHAHLLRVFGILEGPPPFRLVIQYCAGGSVHELLHGGAEGEERRPLSWRQRSKLLLDTASAMEYLHGRTPPVVHSDLRSASLLLAEPVVGLLSPPHVKVTALGFARTGPRSAARGADAWPWLAPELLDGGGGTLKADVYSFAMLGYEAVCRAVPFEGMGREEAFSSIRAGRRPSLAGSDCGVDAVTSGLVGLVEKCWQQEPFLRPSFWLVRLEVFQLQLRSGAGDVPLPSS